MKKTILAVLALLLTASMVFAFAACGGKDTDVTTTVADTTVEGDTTEEATTVEGDTTEEATTVEGDTTQTATEVGNPQTKAEILAMYTTVMNKAKQSKPGFTQKEWQALPKEHHNMGSGAINRLLPIAESFMTEGDPAVKAKGGDMNSFPLKDSSKGCLLTNANAIKSAKYEELANGNHRITIVLNNEVNPEPYKKGQAKATSNIGNMFFVLGKSDIDNELQNNNMVKLVIKEANYSLTYRDCKATLEFNPQTQQIVSLKHYVNAFIDMKGRIIVLGNQEGTAVLEMFYEAYGFKY